MGGWVDWVEMVSWRAFLSVLVAFVFLFLAGLFGVALRTEVMDTLCII